MNFQPSYNRKRLQPTDINRMAWVSQIQEKLVVVILPAPAVMMLSRHFFRSFVHFLSEKLFAKSFDVLNTYLWPLNSSWLAWISKERLTRNVNEAFRVAECTVLGSMHSNHSSVYIYIYIRRFQQWRNFFVRKEDRELVDDRRQVRSLTVTKGNCNLLS